jgi:hypothetical protein
VKLRLSPKKTAATTDVFGNPAWNDKLAPGVQQVTLPSLCDFQNLIAQEFNNTRRYIWRGQQCENWKLESSFARRTHDKKSPVERLLTLQLERFKKAARGRRGSNPSKLSDNEWWALGQHFGLATPLLDWTVSPYVALYFAFADPDHKDQTKYRCVFGLQKPLVKRRSTEIKKLNRDDAQVLKFFEPDSDENSRVLSQRGLFTLSPTRATIEDWVTDNFKSPTSAILLRILVPNTDRENCLKMLNRMNINHLTLFPDLIGAAQFANIHLDVLNY